MRTMQGVLVLLICTVLYAAGERAPIRVDYPQEGMTLRITSRCPAGVQCPFTAEVYAPPATFAKIRKVDYTWVPDRRKSPAPVTSASTHFRIDGVQHEGELIWADVMLEGAKAPVMLKGEVPFAVTVRPALPAGLRFEMKYEQQYLEGGIALPEHYFRLWLRGDPAAMKTIRGVEFRVPREHGAGSRQANTDSEYFFDGSASKPFDILAVIRFTNGDEKTYAVPFAPR